MCHGFRFITVYQKLISSFLILAAFASSFVLADSNRSGQKSVSDIVSKAAQEHKILYKLTTLDEFKQIVGQPIKETKRTDGGMEVCDIEYSDIRARFGKMRNTPAPFTILWIAGFDIGKNRQIVLRDTNDLNKFDSFWGFADVSLVNLDLRQYKKLLDDMPFDSLTKWPEPNMLPEGFNPARLLEKGKNPGLGIRGLHKQGINGKGVGIAVIDQPLLKEHQEYSDQLVYYKELEVEGVPIQMHGPPVCSIAVGKTCGVAPKALLYYYAVPPWKWTDNKPWADVLDEIIAFNKTLKDSEKIRVVSISLGAFSQRPNFDSWEKAVKKAAEHGIIVVTCDPTFLKLGTLKRIEDKSPEEPSSYERSRYYHPGTALAVPTSNRTIANHRGREVYTYERTGGMSWAVPYLAGLAALAYQVDPEIEPETIVKLWTLTAVRTDAGPIVNPVGFIEAVRKLQQNNK